MSKTCTACRTRKMRCDGVTPICGPCSRARKPIDCTYSAAPSPSQGSKAALLQKGAACLACRRKKKKCDANRPFCNTCKVAGKELECEYDDEIRQSVTAALLLRTQELEQRLAMYESQRTPMSPPAPLDIQGLPADFDIPLHLFDFPAQPEAMPGPAGPSHIPMMPQPATSPSTGFPPVTMFDLHDGLQTPESFTRMLLPNPPLHFSDSSALPPQNTYELRSTFMAHTSQVGIWLRESKWKAIKEGDHSGKIVHSALVHLSQLIGGVFWRMHNRTDSLIINEEIELRNTFRALERRPDPTTMLSVFCLLAWYHLYKRQLEEGRNYLVKGYQHVIEYGLQLAKPRPDAMTNNAEPDDDTKELVVALSQLLYLDKAGIIVLNMPSVLNDEYDRQVKALPLMQPWLAKHCIVTMRARSVYFLQQALRLSRIRTESASKTMLRQEDYTALTPDWYTQYWETLEEVSTHVALLSPQMLKSTLCSDPRHGVVLKVCMMIALAAELELHRLPATYHAESRQRVIDVVLEIVGLTKGLKDEDYALLDPILGSCWTIVATALCQEREHFLEIAEMEPTAQWGEAFSLMIACASKLGSRVPYMEHSLRALCGVASMEQTHARNRQNSMGVPPPRNMSGVPG